MLATALSSNTHRPDRRPDHHRPGSDLLYATVDPAGFTSKDFSTTGENSWNVLQGLSKTYPDPRVKDIDHQELRLVPVRR